ncbi:SMC-Scp complex subunit ScpB [Chloroflexi bacterium TSY]|nr:SMC-Scp complex subunit ScpB [Chloroflexi bacterium TSY]
MVTIGDAQIPLTTMLESLLFVAETPTAPEQFARVLDLPTDDVEYGILQLAEFYKTNQRGLRIQERDGRYLLVTLPATANAIEHFLNLDLSMKLSGPALEALAIIAYRQPVTRQQVEAVRGVDCGHVLRILLQHELIAETGRRETVGRPILYGITDRFMQHFGLTGLDELPKLELKEEELLWATTELEEEEGKVEV